MRKKEVVRLWSVLLWLCVWQAVSMGLGSDILLVSPLRVVVRLGELCVTLPFWKAVLFSLLRISTGFILALCAGIVFGALSVRFAWVEQLLAPLMLAVKSVPVASFIILALVWVSSRNLSVLIAFLIAWPVIYTNVRSGIRAVDPALLEMAQVFGVNTLTRVRCIYLPGMMSALYAGCTVALGMCWKAGVAAEVIGISQGSIGEMLQQAKVYLNTSDLFAWTLVIVLMSAAFEKVFLALLARVARAAERV